MSLWVGLGIAAFLLLLGMLGLLGGGFVVFQQMRKRNAARAARARRALEEAMPVPSPMPTPAAASPTPRPPKAQAVSFSSAATDPRGGDVTVPREKPAPPPPPSAAASPSAASAPPGASPTLLPDVDDFEDDVPTGVFRPSQYQDIDAMMKEADKYVSTHRKGS